MIETSAEQDVDGDGGEAQIRHRIGLRFSQVSARVRLSRLSSEVFLGRETFCLNSLSSLFVASSQRSSKLAS